MLKLITVELRDWQAAEEEATISGASHTYACCCVVAQALKRHGLNVLHVGTHDFRVNDRKQRIRLPLKATALIHKFDSWPAIAGIVGEPESFLPASFEIELPEKSSGEDLMGASLQDREILDAAEIDDAIERSDYSDQQERRKNQQIRRAHQGNMRISPGERR